MPTILRHSCLEYWAFVQHCFSKVVNLVNNKLLAFFVTASSACSFKIDSLSLRTSSRTVLSLSSNLLCRDRTIGMRSCLRSSSSESPVYVAKFQLLKRYQDKNAGCKVRKLEILHRHVCSLQQLIFPCVVKFMCCKVGQRQLYK